MKKIFLKITLFYLLFISSYALAGQDLYRLIPNPLKNKITIITFWASWCPNCLEELKELNKFKKINSNLPVNIIAICTKEDNPQKSIIKFKKGYKFQFNFIADENLFYANSFNIDGVPQTFVFVDGRLQKKTKGKITINTEQLIQKSIL